MKPICVITSSQEAAAQKIKEETVMTKASQKAQVQCAYEPHCQGQFTF